MKRIYLAAALACVVWCGRVAATEIDNGAGKDADTISNREPGAASVTGRDRISVALEGMGSSRSVVFRDQTDSDHEFRIRLEDGVASFDGESLVENDEIFGEAVRAAQFMPGDLTAASMVRLNPAFQDTKKRGKVLVMLQRIKALELASRPSSAFGG